MTFALFTEGLQKFNDFYQKGYFSKIYATNLTYRKEELQAKEWFREVDMSKFIALIVDTLNLDDSLGSLMDPSGKIKSLIEKYRKKEITSI